MTDWAAVQTNSGERHRVGISSAQASSSFSARFTRLLTGYFFMNLGSSVSRPLGENPFSRDPRRRIRRMLAQLS
jgi:hypothetical protein